MIKFIYFFPRNSGEITIKVIFFFVSKMINNIKLLNLKKERKINVKDYGINEMIGYLKQ